MSAVLPPASARAYLYKLTSDRGGAPCAPPPARGSAPLLSLSICKPAIRRTAQPGDRILGISSHSLVRSEGYPSDAVIYAAVVKEAVDGRLYYALRSRFRSRPDCIYRFHQETGKLDHAGLSPLHADEAYRTRDIGQYPFYKNGRTLLSEDFRYFGSAARPIPAAFPHLCLAAANLGQAHRVFHSSSPEWKELNRLFARLWLLPTRHTPAIVRDEAYGHSPPRTRASTSPGFSAS